MCITPPSPYFRKPLVKVTSNGQLMNDDISTSSAIFVYDTPIKVKGFFPIAGPASGNFSVQVSGGPFNQTDELRCKFGHIAVQAFYIDEGLIDCYAPPHPPGWYPFEVTTNDQDYTTSRIPFFFYADPNLSRISPVSGPAVVAGTQVQVYGSGFINSTSLTCRFGWTNAPGVYVSSNYIVCPTPRLDEGLSGGMSWTALSEQFNRYRDPKYQNTVFRDTEDPTALFPGAYFYPLYLSRLVTVEVSNNNQDFTNSGINFLYQADAFVESVLPNVGQVNTRTAIVVKGDNFVNSTLLRCRIGEYVSTPTFLSRDLVLCFTPRIPLIAADHAYVNTRRTKNEFIPHERSSDTGPVDSPPNIVYVEVSNNGQDFTNNKLTFTFDVKCATGYYCPQQSQTACPPGTFCPGEFNKNFTLCETFWRARHLLPLSIESPFKALRGRFCLDDRCLHFTDESDFQASDYMFDYSSVSFKLRRPVPCPAGMYCHPGVGSADPAGAGECPPGYYCPFGKKIACPTGTYCPRDGHWDPVPCPPGRFSAMVAVPKCTPCAKGFICPGFGRSPNHRCPSGFFCPNGTLTVDPFRNDTALRPYPCKPGTYCLTGVGFSDVVSGDFAYAQYCTEGFYCEAKSNSPRGNGLCPKGFVCPLGTAIPKPAPKGKYAELRR
eukprot:GSChrysophyteH1.ASY1.ANO1.3355.1 assembled CDS